MADPKLPALADEEAVSILLVNLWYPTENLNPYPGFGYLIPPTVTAAENPHGALGVIFDSDRETLMPIDDDDDHPQLPGTKFTVMLGGWLWGHLDPHDRTQWPSDAQAIDMAKDTLARHLGIPGSEAARAVGSVKLCSDCIPQHVVGHGRRMAAAHGELLRGHGGRLAVVGPSFNPPGVLGSLRAARDVAQHVARVRYRDFGPAEHLVHVGETGLARFADRANERLAPIEDSHLEVLHRLKRLDGTLGPEDH